MKFREAIIEAMQCCKKFPDCENCKENCAEREVEIKNG